MRVKEIMSPAPRSCRPDDKLSTAAWSMWSQDCGVLPVVDDTGMVVGMLTDRDICMALMLKNRPPSAVFVRDVITGQVVSCAPHDDVHLALKLLSESKIRRLPVVHDGKLVGVLSLNDVMLAAEEKGDVTLADAVFTMKAVCSHWAPQEILSAA